MSADIFTSKMSYNRKVKEDGSVSETTHCIRDDRTGVQIQEGGADCQQPAPVRRTSYRAAALCLGLLCLLMITANIILSICFALEKEQLLKRYNNLNMSYSQLQGQLLGKWCPNGWSRFGCSCYFKSTEKKRWFETEIDCRLKGAHLVIVNNKEEQEFVQMLNMNEESWIGLTTHWKVTSNVWEWKWVDGSPLTQTFLATSDVKHTNYWAHATCCDRQEKVTVRGFYASNNWICEKQISCFY